MRASKEKYRCFAEVPSAYTVSVEIYPVERPGKKKNVRMEARSWGDFRDMYHTIHSLVDDGKIVEEMIESNTGNTLGTLLFKGQ